MLFGVINLISSNPASNKHSRDTCTFRDGEKVPTFMYHLGGDQFIEILCSKDTCHCDGSNTGYKGCQSCCCAMREKHEGNKKINKIHSRVNPFFSKAQAAVNLKFCRNSAPSWALPQECCELLQNSYFLIYLWRSFFLSPEQFFSQLIISIRPSEILCSKSAIETLEKGMECFQS